MAPRREIDQGRAAGRDVGRSVGFRRALLARYIDVTASRTSDATVLSVGCGGLSEASLSRAACEGDLGRFVALDRDARNIARVSASYGRFGVEPILGSVEELLQRGAPGEFDLIYAAQLYNHLTDDIARPLTATLFRAVRPGGTLLVANVARRHAEQDYLGAGLDRTLLRRNPAEMVALASDVPSAAIAESKVFDDPSGNLLYLELVRGATSAD